ncbi:LOW QUALITY PROTEIN: hypothetical protein MXB_5203 [Myxobolus squamalis]|nr:LOW QUALITY PROTEIN: hypothetical protein MXB_5203 [Myxobolus squamalis]
MSTKDEYLYCEVLHSIIISLKYRLSLKLVVMDFEKALLNAVRYQFTSTRIMLLPLLTGASLKDD